MTSLPRTLTALALIATAATLALSGCVASTDAGDDEDIVLGASDGKADDTSGKTVRIVKREQKSPVPGTSADGTVEVVSKTTDRIVFSADFTRTYIEPEMKLATFDIDMSPWAPTTAGAVVKLAGYTAHDYDRFEVVVNCQGHAIFSNEFVIDLRQRIISDGDQESYALADCGVPETELSEIIVAPIPAADWTGIEGTYNWTVHYNTY